MRRKMAPSLLFDHPVKGSRILFSFLVIGTLTWGVQVVRTRIQREHSHPISAPSTRQPSDPRFVGPLLRHLAPQWAKQGFRYYSAEERANALASDQNIRQTLSLIPKELQVTPINEQQANELTQRYNDLMRGYEDRERRGLLSPAERAERNDAARGFMNGVLSDIRNRQFTEKRDQLLKLLPKKNLEKMANAIPKPIQMATAVVGAVATGQPMDWHLVPEASLRTQLDLPNQRSQISLFTHVVDTSFSIRGQSAGNVDPNAPPPPLNEFPAHSFRYEVSVSKQAPELALSAGVTYISTTESMRASVSKVLVPNLVAEIGTHQPLNPNNKLQPREESVRLQYGMQF